MRNQDCRPGAAVRHNMKSGHRPMARRNVETNNQPITVMPRSQLLAWIKPTSSQRCQHALNDKRWYHENQMGRPAQGWLAPGQGHQW
jgi:hypothetical protein